MKVLQAVAVCASLLFPLAGAAQINKCTDANGKVSFQQGPCASGAKTAQTLKEGARWDASMDAVRKYAPEGVQVTSVRGQDGKILVEGKSDEYSTVNSYVWELQRSKKYLKVELVDMDPAKNPNGTRYFTFKMMVKPVAEDEGASE